MEFICDVPALNVRLVDVVNVMGFPDKVKVEAFKFIVLVFELLDESELAVTE